jgi:hypothetical protein
LSRFGWVVWRDDRTRAGTEFDLVVEEQLDAALCVVVIWSSASVVSKWVRAEAGAADSQGKMIPVTFQRDLLLPLLFRQVNTPYLTGTDFGDLKANARGFLDDIAERTGKPPVGVDLRSFRATDRERSSGARVVTPGAWRLQIRVAGIRVNYQLQLRPNGTLDGSARFGFSSKLAGRWQFDPSSQTLFLEMSGGTESGMKAAPLTIIRWTTADSAECRWERKRATLERVGPKSHAN